jgi:serine/threonine protein kinase/Tol biopolymer transport system component
MPLVPGTKLGPYEILSPLGSGGMGEVYRARDTRLDRTVAVKILPTELSADPIRKQRFEREAKAISGLNHPHICTLFDVGNQDGTDFIVMECVEGETLATRLQKGSLPIEQALKYGVQMADALDRAHRNSIVHRDLKPGNIMLTSNGAKLLDFGLAKSAAPPATLATMTGTRLQSAPVTEEGAIVGTFQYMSPEQIEGREVDGRSDIFSLGAVLYEMLTGKKAFEGKSQLSVASAILDKEPEPVSVAKPMTPPVLDRVVGKCLAKLPDERWQSASDLATELKWLAEGDLSTRTARVAEKRVTERLGWLLSSALLLLVAGGLVWWSRSTEPKRTTYYSSPFHLGANDLTLSPDGKIAALVAYWEQGNKYVIWTYRLGEANAAVVEGTDSAMHPFWSPDGRFIAFFTQGKLKKVDLQGKSVQVICDAPNGRGGTWNKNGVILYTPDVFLGIYRVSAEGGTPAEETKLDDSRSESSHRWPIFLPDGKHYIYLSANFSGQFDKNALFLGELGSKEKHLLVGASSNASFAEPGYLLYMRDNELVAQSFDLKSFSLTGQPRQILRGVYSMPVLDLALFDVSENGTLVAQTGSALGVSRLTWFDRDGKAVGNLGPAGTYANPNLSPDGRRVAYDQRSPDGRAIGVWVQDVKSDTALHLTLHPSLNQVPVWGADGKKIVFTSNRKLTNKIFQKNADGSGSEDQITDIKAGRMINPWDWSRDGKYLLARNEGELWYYSPAEDKSHPYIKGPWVVRNAQFSPDGKYVAYATNETGDWEIYVSPFPDAGSKWQVSRGGGEEPRWRADGKELFFVSPDGKLMASNVKLGASFEATTPTPLFQTRRRQKISSQDVFTYAVTDDGTKFLFNTLMDQREVPPLTIIRNWNAELEK